MLLADPTENLPLDYFIFHSHEKKSELEAELKMSVKMETSEGSQGSQEYHSPNILNVIIQNLYFPVEVLLISHVDSL